MTKVEDTFLGKEYDEYESMSPEDWYKHMKELIGEAEKAGYTNCTIALHSTFEPYERDMLGPVQMCVQGLRDKTEKELESEEREEIIKKTMIEYNCTYYYASMVVELKENNII